MLNLLNKINSNGSILKYLFFLLLAFFPIYSVLGSFLINLSVCLVSIFFLFFLKSLKYIKKYNFFLLPLFIFYFYLIFVSLIYLDDYTIEWLKVVSLIRYPLFFSAFIIFFNYINSKYYNNYYKIFFLFTIFVIVDLLIQYKFSTNLFGYTPQNCSDIKYSKDCSRYSGIFGDELILGSYFSTVIFANFFYFIEKKKEKKLNIFLKLIPFFLIFPVILTGERSASLLVLITLISYTIYLYSFNKKTIILIVIIFFLILPFIFKNQNIKDRFLNQTLEIFVANNSFSIDKFLHSPWGLHYQAGFKIFLENPFFGNGYKSFKKKCSKYNYYKLEDLNRSNVINVCSTHPHNFILEILIDYGLIGLILFLFFIFRLFVFLLRSIKINIIDKNDKNYFKYFLVSFIFIFIFLPRPTGSFVSTNFSTTFWYLLGLISAGILIKDKRI
jgi:O-antigen ligase